LHRDGATADVTEDEKQLLLDTYLEKAYWSGEDFEERMRATPQRLREKAQEGDDS
jgi:hypothetical protein